MKRPWLLPFTPLWAVGAAWKNRAYDRSPRRAQHLQRPVISVGSLSAGGAGKTPFVIALARALAHSGIAVDVLSRGYGRTNSAAQRVHPDSPVAEAGDEPLLIARALGVPVYVAAQRFDAGRLAESDPANTAAIHLLDDGFQHRQLARAIDIVLLTLQDIEDALLPAGDLREPLQSMHRADILVLREEEAADLHPVLERLRLNKPTWIIHRTFEITEGPPELHPLAFCGIARPASFHTALAAAGITPAAFVPLRDHQRYHAATIDRLLRTAARANSTGFLTTAKDAVKLSPALRVQLQPLSIADITVRLHNEEACVAMLKALLGNTFPA